MGKFRIVVEDKAKEDLKQIYKSGDKATIKRLEKIIKELEEHPTTGLGNPKLLKYDFAGLWSRRINKKDRLIYEIQGKKVLVLILEVLGHYSDK